MSKLIEEAKTAILASPLCQNPLTRDVSAQDILDAALAPLAEAVEVVELIHSLGNVTIVLNGPDWADKDRYSVRVGGPWDKGAIWGWGATLVEALRKVRQTQEETR